MYKLEAAFYANAYNFIFYQRTHPSFFFGEKENEWDEMEIKILRKQNRAQKKNEAE